MIRDYRDTDLGLQLRLLGDPVTTAHLGGPETPEQIERRHRRYLAMTGPEDGRMLVIETADGDAAGCVGYWPRTWQDHEIWETGWFVLPGFRGRGLAAAGVGALIDRLGGEPGRRFLHAFPAERNDASNAVCRKVGFALSGVVDFAYPPGRWMRCNDWRYDLRG